MDLTHKKWYLQGRKSPVSKLGSFSLENSKKNPVLSIPLLFLLCLWSPMWFYSRFDTSLGYFDPGQPHLKRLPVADGYGNHSIILNTFWIFDAFRPLNSQTLNSQWNTCKETQEWLYWRITFFKKSKTQCKIKHGMFIWSWGYGIPETGSMVPTNKFFIEMETQMLANKPKEHRKQKERHWDSPKSSERFMLF